MASITLETAFQTQPAGFAKTSWIAHLAAAGRSLWQRTKEPRTTRQFHYHAEKQQFANQVSCHRRNAGTYHNLFEC